MTRIQKIQAFIITKVDSKYQLLVFEHDITKIHQLIRGTVESDEDYLEAAIREVFEESGITQLSFIKKLGEKELKIKSGPTRSGPIESQIHHAYLFKTSERANSKWTHYASGSKEEDGLKFHFYWTDIDSRLNDIIFDDFQVFLPEFFKAIYTLDLEGSFNTRDLFGANNYIMPHKIFRSDKLEFLTQDDWQQLYDYGIRTVIDLRNKSEIKSDIHQRPREISTIQIDLDGGQDTEFWKKWSQEQYLLTPIYYEDHIKKFPHLIREVIHTISDELDNGGVLFHCASGKDRTGLISIFLLKVFGIPNQFIIEDYMLSKQLLPPLYKMEGRENQQQFIDDFLKKKNTNIDEVLTQFIQKFDEEDFISKISLDKNKLDNLKKRLF